MAAIAPVVTVQAVRVFPDPILEQICRPAVERDFETGFVAQVAQDLADTMAWLDEHSGLRCAGLAAPQIGYDLRVFRLAQWPGAFVNPELEYVVGKPVTDIEGCFSLPGLQLQVGRAAKIRLRYLTVTGEERATKMRDRDARAAQHEYDHLDGITIVQRADGGVEIPAATA